jgi:hypothetical protein
MSIIQECYTDINNLFNNEETPCQLFNRCARVKLEKVYTQETDTFDKLLDELEMNIDYNSVTQIKVCVSKILRLLSYNRKTLLQTLRRLYK